MLSLTILEILTFYMFDLENIGQDQRVQHGYWCHLMANINVYESQNVNFVLALSVSDILMLQMLYKFDLENLGHIVLCS